MKKRLYRRLANSKNGAVAEERLLAAISLIWRFFKLAKFCLKSLYFLFLVINLIQQTKRLLALCKGSPLLLQIV